MHSVSKNSLTFLEKYQSMNTAYFSCVREKRSILSSQSNLKMIKQVEFMMLNKMLDQKKGKGGLSKQAIVLRYRILSEISKA